MKTHAMRSNEIKLFSEILQGLLRIDSRDDAANAEELGRPAEKRFIIGVEPETLVAKHSAEIEKITGAAAKIQDIERRRAIKPEVLYALYVNAYPVVGVLVSVDLSRVRSIRIMLAQPYQFRFIDRGENPSRAYRVRPAASVFPQTFHRVAGEKLLKFSRGSHGKRCRKERLCSRSDVFDGRHSFISIRIRPVEPSLVMNPLVQPLPG